MRRLFVFGLLLILVPVPAALSEAPAAPDAPVLTGELTRVGGIPVLTLWGTPRERGFAQGWLLAKEIVTGTDTGLTGFLGDRMSMYADRILPLAGTAFRFSDDEIAEMEGILEGVRARLPEKERVIPCLGREASLADIKVLNTFGDWYTLGCSSLAVWGDLTEDGKAAVVRNFDFLVMDLVLTHQHLRVVAPPPGDTKTHGWVGVSHPGGVGALTAMGENGVFAAIHDVLVKPGLKDIWQGNVPRLLALRRIVEGVPAKGAVERATELCRGWNTLFGNNFLVATPEPGDGLPAGVLEYDTREQDDHGVDLRGPDAAENGTVRPWVVCSNHYRIRAHGTCSRYDALFGGAAAAKGPLTVANLFDLGDRAAMPGPGQALDGRRFGTLHQVVALTGSRKLYVRMAKREGNIRDAKAVEFDVAALIAGAAKRGRKE